MYFSLGKIWVVPESRNIHLCYVEVINSPAAAVNVAEHSLVVHDLPVILIVYVFFLQVTLTFKAISTSISIISKRRHVRPTARKAEITSVGTIQEPVLET